MAWERQLSLSFEELLRELLFVAVCAPSEERTAAARVGERVYWAALQLLLNHERHLAHRQLHDDPPEG